jgi:hypothetical protein
MSIPEPNPPAIRHQVLADPTGRRRRRLAIAGRVATGALGLWLVVLILGGFGLQPLGGLPIIGDLGAGVPAPPALPKRLRNAVARHTTVAPAPPPAQVPATTTPSPTKTQPPARTTPATTTPSRSTTTPTTIALGQTKTSPATTAPGQTKTPPGQTKTSPATTAPGQTKTPPGQTKTSPATTAPGQTKTPPGQTKTSLSTTSTASTRPAGNGNARGVNGAVTTR